MAPATARPKLAVFCRSAFNCFSAPRIMALQKPLGKVAACLATHPLHGACHAFPLVVHLRGSGPLHLLLSSAPSHGVGHKSRRLPNRRALELAFSNLSAVLALVARVTSYTRKPKQPLNTSKPPRIGYERVLMQEVEASVILHFLKGAAVVDVHGRPSELTIAWGRIVGL